MTIYGDIKTLLVTGLVLFLVKTGRTYPLPLHRKTYSPEKQLIITRKPCYDSIGNAGVCMFKYDCIRQKGATLSTCVDGFLFGACCLLKESSFPKITDAPFEKENEFIYQKQSNVISEIDDILQNADLFNLTKYSNPENEMFSTNFFSSLIEVNMNVSTYTTATTFLNNFDEKDITIKLTENNNSLKNFSFSSINTTDENVKIFEYDEEENDQNYNSHVSIDAINSESIDDIVNILDNITISSYETKLYNSTEPSEAIHYEWKESASTTHDNKIVPTDNWSLTSKLSISEIHEKDVQIEPIGRIPETSIDFPSENHTLQSIVDSKVLSTTQTEQKGTTEMEKFTIMTRPPPDDKEGSELHHSNFTNFSEDITKKLATHHYEISKVNPISNITLYVDNATEIPTFNSESYPLLATTISQGEKATSKQVFSNMEDPDEKSFTIYSVPSSYSTEKDKESTISTFTKGNTLPDQSLLSLDGASRITTQVLPILPEWPAQNQLPASFQTLVAQLSSGEIPSPITSHFNSNAQTLQPIDKGVHSEQKLPSEQITSHSERVSDSSSEDFYDTNNHSKGQNTSNVHKDTHSSILPTTLSLDEGQTEIVTAINNKEKTASYANSYTTTDGKFSLTVKGDNQSNFETTVHPDEYLYTISSSQGAHDSNGVHKNSQQSENTSPDFQSESTTVLEVLSVATFLNISHTANQVQSHGEYTSTPTTDSFELKFNNTPNSITSPFDFSNENILSNNTELDSEWLETAFYGQILKVPEIINNHSNKSTFITDAAIINDKVDMSIVSTTQFPFLNYTTLVTANTLHKSTLNSKLENLDKTTDMAPDDMFSVSNAGGSNENTHILDTDTSFTESSTSQNFLSEFTSLFMNQLTVNETSTVDNSTSPLDSSHELVKIVDFQEMNSNGSQFTNITDDKDSPSKIHENLPILIPISQTNFTVFKDDLDKVYENTSSVSISFSGNIETNQFNKMNLTENHFSDIEFVLNYDKEINISLSNVSSLTNYVTSEMTTLSISRNESLSLKDFENSTVITSTDRIGEEESTSSIPTTYTESTKISLPPSPNEYLDTNIKVTEFEGNAENSTPSTDYFSVQTFTEIYSDTSMKNVTFLTSDDSVMETTQIQDITLTSQNSSLLVETAAHSSTPTKVSEPSTETLPVLTTPNMKWDYKKDCGVRLMQPIGRIVGGKNTYFGKWPWQALVKEATWLGLFLKNKCGGVLITAKYVLTAAHCQPGFFASLLVVLGTHDLAETFDNKASVIRNVKRMVVHRRYNPQTFENDLALLEMETPVEFSPYVVPICLPFRKEDFTSKMAFVTGWGKLTHGGDVPNILQEVQVPIVANGDCQRMFFHAGHQKAIRSNFVCAGYTNGGQDSCEGDSGGPLMVQREDNRWVLVGTVSHGIGCADPNLPGVYMRMSSYRPWIDSIINKHRS